MMISRTPPPNAAPEATPVVTALRAIPDAAAVAKILAEAAETRMSQPIITQTPVLAHAVAAE